MNYKSTDVDANLEQLDPSQKQSKNTNETSNSKHLETSVKDLISNYCANESSHKLVDEVVNL